LKGFIGVDEKLLAKCASRYQCIWVETAIVKPFNTSIFYCMDCFFHNFSLAATPEARLLLSFSSRTQPGDISPGRQGGFKIVEADGSVCSRDGVESYLLSLYDSVVGEIESLAREREKSPQRLSFRDMLLGLVIPRQRDKLQEEGRYWGSLAKRRIIIELMQLLGFENRVLNAEVSQAYVLYGIDRRNNVVAFIGSNTIELPSYSKLLDMEKVRELL